jgi:hypothetical protein
VAPICEPCHLQAASLSCMQAPGSAAVPGQISRASRIRALGVLPLPAPTIAASTLPTL